MAISPFSATWRNDIIKALAGLEPLNDTLSAIAALTGEPGKGIYFTGEDSAALFTLTEFARTLLDDADASAALSTLGVSDFAKTLLDDADASAALTTLGVSAAYGAVGFATKAEADANLDYEDGTIARVYGDENEAFRGVYRKNGDPGLGSWTRIGPLPIPTDLGEFLYSATISNDWNILTTSGIYRTPLGGVAEGSPISAVNMTVEHIESIGGRAWQTARQADHVAVRAWERFRKSDGAWGPWVLIRSQANEPEGVNIFDGTYEHRKAIPSSSTDGVPIDNNEFWLTGFIPVNPGSAYSFPEPGITKVVAFYDAEQEFISTALLTTGVVNTPEDAAFIRIPNRYSDIWPDRFVVIEGRRELTLAIPGNGAIRGGSVGKFTTDNAPIAKTRNLFDLEHHSPNTAINTSGDGYSNGSFYATDFIAIQEGATYSFSTPSAAVRWAYYDSDRVFISAFLSSGSFTVPAGTGATFVRGSLRYEDTAPEQLTIVKGTQLPATPQPFAGSVLESPINKDVPNGYPGLGEDGKLDPKVVPDIGVSPLYGKVIAGLGDSITYGFIPRNAPGYPGQLNSYLRLLGTKFGAATVRNYGISGSTLAYHATRNPMSRRFNAMNDDADLIILMGGTNDVRNGIVLGNMGDTTDDTYYGALDVLAQGLLNKYRYNQGTEVGQDKKIVFSTPIRLLDTNEADGLNALLHSFCQAVKDVGEKYSIPVFDAYNLSGLTPELFRTLQGTEPGYTDMYNPYVTDGTHPTQEGHHILADAFAGFIRGLY